MLVVAIIIVVLIGFGIYSNFIKKEEETHDVITAEEVLSDEKDSNMKTGSIKTKDLVIQTLRELGCESEENEDERILFAYQGISFFIEAADDCLFIYLIWPWCYSFSKFDVDEFARVRKVVNELNTRGAISVFYGFSDSDEVAVHLKKHFIFIQQIPDLKGYLSAMLDNFFATARALNLEIEKLRITEEAH